MKEKQSKTGWRISDVGLIICGIICEKESNGTYDEPTSAIRMQQMKATGN